MAQGFGCSGACAALTGGSVVEEDEIEIQLAGLLFGLFGELLDDAEGGDDFFPKDGVHWEIMNATE